MRLNPNQQQAINYISGPCLVLAGAGSGKTRVITKKIAYLIRECGYSPKHIVALTFTNKAAKEMKERVVHEIGRKNMRGLIISTFHSLGIEFIRREWMHLGIKQQFILFDSHDQLALLKELTNDEFEQDKDLLQQLISSISNWKNDFLLPEQVIAHAKSEKEQLFTQYYARYQQHLDKCSILDFDDLILRTTRLLKENEAVRMRWQNRIHYLLIDEYQDTNTSQYELIKVLVGERARFTVVGDDDQSIYSWRGAKPQNLMLLKNDFPSLNVIKLEQNYRSTGCILNAANILIENNPHLFSKTLFSALGYGERIKVLATESEEQEAERTVGELIAHRFVNQTQYKDYAILYRSNHQSRLLEKVLMQNRIPYKISDGNSFFSRVEIKDMMAYLRLLTNCDDDNAFLRIVNVPKRELGATTLQRLGEWAMLRSVSLFRASFDVGLADKLSTKRLAILREFVEKIAQFRELAEREPVKAIQQLFQYIDYQSWLYETSTSPKMAEMRVKNVETLFSWLNGMIEGDDFNEPMTLSQAVANLTLRDILERSDDPNEETDQVQLMTLHAAKGLEFPFVYIIGVEEGILPHQSSIDEENIEEERRLMYVGITRAKRELTCLYTKKRMKFGEWITTEPSRFLHELPQDDLDWQHQKMVPSATERQQKGLSHLAQLRQKLEQAKK